MPKNTSPSIVSAVELAQRTRARLYPTMSHLSPTEIDAIEKEFTEFETRKYQANPSHHRVGDSYLQNLEQVFKLQLNYTQLHRILINDSPRVFATLAKHGQALKNDLGLNNSCITVISILNPAEGRITWLKQNYNEYIRLNLTHNEIISALMHSEWKTSLLNLKKQGNKSPLNSPQAPGYCCCNSHLTANAASTCTNTINSAGRLDFHNVSIGPVPTNSSTPFTTVTKARPPLTWHINHEGMAHIITDAPVAQQTPNNFQKPSSNSAQTEPEQQRKNQPTKSTAAPSAQNTNSINTEVSQLHSQPQQVSTNKKITHTGELSTVPKKRLKVSVEGEQDPHHLPPTPVSNTQENQAQPKQSSIHSLLIHSTDSSAHTGGRFLNPQNTSKPIANTQSSPTTLALRKNGFFANNQMNHHLQTTPPQFTDSPTNPIDPHIANPYPHPSYLPTVDSYQTTVPICPYPLEQNQPSMPFLSFNPGAAITYHSRNPLHPMPMNVQPGMPAFPYPQTLPFHSYGGYNQLPAGYSYPSTNYPQQPQESFVVEYVPVVRAAPPTNPHVFFPQTPIPMPPTQCYNYSQPFFVR